MLLLFILFELLLLVEITCLVGLLLGVGFGFGAGRFGLPPAVVPSSGGGRLLSSSSSDGARVGLNRLMGNLVGCSSSSMKLSVLAGAGVVLVLVLAVELEILPKRLSKLFSLSGVGADVNDEGDGSRTSKLFSGKLSSVEEEERRRSASDSGTLGTRGGSGAVGAVGSPKELVRATSGRFRGLKEERRLPGCHDSSELPVFLESKSSGGRILKFSVLRLVSKLNKFPDVS